MKFGLKKDTISKIVAVFVKYPQVEKVIIYGSRAKGNFKNGSDVDLTLKGPKLSLAVLNKITDEIDNLLLPYTFDVSIYDQISNPDLLDHITGCGQVFYKA
jgi:predicted nucleotidyltransferase